MSDYLRAFLLSLTAVVVVTVVVLGAVALAHHAHDWREHTAQQMVRESCGESALTRFNRAYSDTSSHLKFDAAEKWSARCADRP